MARKKHLYYIATNVSTCPISSVLSDILLILLSSSFCRNSTSRPESSSRFCRPAISLLSFRISFVLDEKHLMRRFNKISTVDLDGLD